MLEHSCTDRRHAKGAQLAVAAAAARSMHSSVQRRDGAGMASVSVPLLRWRSTAGRGAGDVIVGAVRVSHGTMAHAVAWVHPRHDATAHTLLAVSKSLRTLPTVTRKALPSTVPMSRCRLNISGGSSFTCGGGVRERWRRAQGAGGALQRCAVAGARACGRGTRSKPRLRVDAAGKLPCLEVQEAAGQVQDLGLWQLDVVYCQGEAGERRAPRTIQGRQLGPSQGFEPGAAWGPGNCTAGTPAAPGCRRRVSDGAASARKRAKAHPLGCCQ
jgi:hypothetical protein